MVNMNAFPIIQSAYESNSSMMYDFVGFGNIDRENGDIVSTVVADYGDYIEINGLYDTNKYKGRYASVCHEIVLINSAIQSTSTTKLYVSRAQKGTINSYNNPYYPIKPNHEFMTLTYRDWETDRKSTR